MSVTGHGTCYRTFHKYSSPAESYEENIGEIPDIYFLEVLKCIFLTQVFMINRLEHKHVVCLK